MNGLKYCFAFVAGGLSSTWFIMWQKLPSSLSPRTPPVQVDVTYASLQMPGPERAAPMPHLQDLSPLNPVLLILGRQPLYWIRWAATFTVCIIGAYLWTVITPKKTSPSAASKEMIVANFFDRLLASVVSLETKRSNASLQLLIEAVILHYSRFRTLSEQQPELQTYYRCIREEQMLAANALYRHANLGVPLAANTVDILLACFRALASPPSVPLPAEPTTTTTTISKMATLSLVLNNSDPSFEQIATAFIKEVRSYMRDAGVFLLLWRQDPRWQEFEWNQKQLSQITALVSGKEAVVVVAYVCTAATAHMLIPNPPRCSTFITVGVKISLDGNATPSAKELAQRIDEMRCK